jgi:general secretion pathway protein G
MRRRQTGLTFLEMFVVLAILGLLAMGALPFAHYAHRRHQETELRRALAVMRSAIDLYHEYAVFSQIEPWDLAWNMYPKDLQMLVDGVDVQQVADKPPVKMKFLRAIPVDPMTSQASWDCRGYNDGPDDRSGSCDDLYDVYSQSEAQALDGSYYRNW